MAHGMTSPEATGGAGTVFEYRVAALAFGRLLRGAHVPVGIDLPVESVALQQRISGSVLDDIVIRACSESQTTTIEFQVKKNLEVTGSSAELTSVLSQAAHTWRTREQSLSSGRLVLGVAARGPQDHLEDLASLASKARSHSSVDSFRLLLAEGVTNRRLRSRHDHLVKAMAAAIGVSEHSEAANLTHQVLSRLHVWQVDPSEDGRDWRTALDELGVLSQRSDRSAESLLLRLVDLAERVGPNAGDLDADAVRAQLRSRFALDLASPDISSSPLARNIQIKGDGPTFMSDSMVFNGLTITTRPHPTPPKDQA